MSGSNGLATKKFLVLLISNKSLYVGRDKTFPLNCFKNHFKVDTIHKIVKSSFSLLTFKWKKKKQQNGCSFFSLDPFLGFLSTRSRIKAGSWPTLSNYRLHECYHPFPNSRCAACLECFTSFQSPLCYLKEWNMNRRHQWFINNEHRLIDHQHQRWKSNN